MKPHYKLDAWKESRILVKMVYEVTKQFPPEELYSLTNQIRRCAISIPSNIAEGAARSGNREFAQFLSVAQGSLAELETQLILSVDLGYTTQDIIVFHQLSTVSKLISGLRKAVKARV